MSNFFKEKLMKEIGKENISCGHNQNHFEEDFVLTENSLHCDNCFESITNCADVLCALMIV